MCLVSEIGFLMELLYKNTRELIEGAFVVDN